MLRCLIYKKELLARVWICVSPWFLVESAQKDERKRERRAAVFGGFRAAAAIHTRLAHTAQSPLPAPAALSCACHRPLSLLSPLI